MTKMQDKETAKAIILQIVQQAGGVLENKTNLFKAFYYAHIYFAEKNGYYLSTWPIVRMPRGPGIDCFEVLIGELMAEGKIECFEVTKGQCQGFCFRLRPTTKHDTLPPGAEEAIKFALKRVAGKRATHVSAQSHLDSRSWRETANGEELNIYIDTLSEEEYRAARRRMKKLASDLDKAW